MQLCRPEGRHDLGSIRNKMVSMKVKSGAGWTLKIRFSRSSTHRACCLTSCSQGFEPCNVVDDGHLIFNMDRTTRYPIKHNATTTMVGKRSDSDTSWETRDRNNPSCQKSLSDTRSCHKTWRGS